MAEALPPAENVDDAMKRAAEAIRAMRHIPKDETAAQARVRACAAIAAQRELAEAARRTMVDAVSAKQQTKSNGHAPAKGPFDEEVLGALAKGLVEWLGPILKDIETRLAGLEAKKGLTGIAARLTQIEMNSLRYEGVWREGKSYSRGSFVTHAGSLWFAEDANIARPGAGSSSWKLAVKKGHAER